MQYIPLPASIAGYKVSPEENWFPFFATPLPYPAFRASITDYKVALQLAGTSITDYKLVLQLAGTFITYYKVALQLAGTFITYYKVVLQLAGTFITDYKVVLQLAGRFITYYKVVLQLAGASITYYKTSKLTVWKFCVCCKASLAVDLDFLHNNSPSPPLSCRRSPVRKPGQKTVE